MTITNATPVKHSKARLAPHVKVDGQIAVREVVDDKRIIGYAVVKVAMVKKIRKDTVLASFQTERDAEMLARTLIAEAAKLVEQAQSAAAECP